MVNGYDATPYGFCGQWTPLVSFKGTTIRGEPKATKLEALKVARIMLMEKMA